MLIVNYLLTECEVTAGKSQTEALMCIDRAITDGAIARSVHQGRGLRFSCSDRTDEVNKLFIIIVNLSLRSIKPTTAQSITFKHMSPQWVVHLSWRYSQVTLVSGYPFDSCQLFIRWMSISMSTIKLNTDCICFGHLASNVWKQKRSRNGKMIMHFYNKTWSVRCTY